MHYNEACRRLAADGIESMVTMVADTPVELLFWDKGLNCWNHYSNIDDNEDIDANAAADLRELYPLPETADAPAPQTGTDTMIAPLTNELVAPAECFPQIARDCRRFAKQADEILTALIAADDSPEANDKWAIIDDMLCDLHDACDAISPDNRRV